MSRRDDIHSRAKTSGKAEAGPPHVTATLDEGSQQEVVFCSLQCAKCSDANRHDCQPQK